MQDPFEVVAEINAFLSGQRAMEERNLADLAATYAHLCKEANARLRRCAEYLRKGLRAEAIYHAEVEPDILSLVSALTLPRADDWYAVCKSENLDAAPALMLEVAEALNEAYAADPTIASLQRQMRLLSLIQAPLKYRLAAVRKIAARDPQNAVLQQDIATFEAARIDEIVAQARVAFETKDLPTLVALLKEIYEDPWQQPVRETVRSSIAGKTQALRIEKATQQLRDLLPGLFNSYAALSYEECASTLTQWQQILADNQLTPPADLQAQVAPIFDWLTTEKQHRSVQQQFSDATARLSRALEDETRLPQIERLWRELAAYDMPIDPDLAKSYRMRCGQLQEAQRRRRRLVTVVATATVVIVVGIVGVLFYRLDVQRRLDRYTTDAQGLLDKGEIEEAQKFVAAADQKESRLDGHAPWHAVRADLDRKIADENERKEQFTQAASKAEAIADEAEASLKAFKESGSKNPDAQELAAARRAFSSAGDDTVGTPKKLARGTEEKLRAMMVDTRISGVRREVQAIIDAAFKSKADPLIKEIGEVDESLCDRNVDEFERQIVALDDKVKALAATPNVSHGFWSLLEPARSQIVGWQSLVTRKRDREKQSLDQQQALADLVTHLDSPADLSAALTTFADKYPTSPWAGDFHRAAGETAKGEAVTEWAAIWKRWAGTFLPTPANSQTIAARTTTVNEYLAKYPQSPFRQALEEYKAYLAKAGEFFADTSWWRSGIIDTFGKLQIMKWWSFTTTDGETYYTPRDAKFSKLGTMVSISVYVDYTDTKAITLEARKITPEVKPNSSPQSKLVSDLKNKVLDIKTSGWETFGFEIVRMIGQREDVDPIVRLNMLGIVLEELKKSTWYAEDKVAQALTRINMLVGEENVSWMDPKDSAANERRAEIRNSLDKVHWFADLGTGVSDKVEKMRKRLAVSCSGRGLALKMPLGDNSGTQWQVSTTPGPDHNNGKVCIVVQSSGDGALVLKEVGQVKDNKYELDQMPSVPSGTVVLILDQTGQ